MKTALVRTGKFRPEALEAAEASPDIVVSSLAQFPALLEEDLTGGWAAVKVGVDIIEIERIERALERPGFRERCFTEAEREYCDSRSRPAQSYAGRFAGKEAVGKALGCGVRFTWKEIEIVGRPKPGVRLSGRTAAFAERVRGGRDRPLDDAFARDRSRDRRRLPALRWLRATSRSTRAAEMRAAEERYPGYPSTIPELMERAGTAVAREAMLAYPAARSFACVCGGGSNGGDGRVAARVLREAGHVADEIDDGLDGYDVVVDALFGTGFRGAPRPEAAALIERINASPAPVVAVDLPSGVDASTGRDRRRGRRRRSHGDVPRARRSASPSRRAGSTPAASSSPTSASTATRPRFGERLPALLDAVPRRGARRHEVLSRLRPRRRRSTRDDGCGVPRGDGGAPRRRRLRHAGRARGVARGRRGAGARAREARRGRTTTPSAVLDGGRAARVGARDRARPRALGARDARSFASCSTQIDLPAVVDADALFGLEPVERDAADRAHSARR